MIKKTFIAGVKTAVIFLIGWAFGTFVLNDVSLNPVLLTAINFSIGYWLGVIGENVLRTK